ncbi:MAG: cell division protein ZipA [Gammaproteobacteria bacterium]|jgi:cell division protein ZipA|nr:cell division protein ZipA [Gammaproteobacteria bacterium]
MDTLRWILLFIGAIVVAGVYVWSRRKAAEEEDVFVRAEPGVGDDEIDPLFAPPPTPSAAGPAPPSAATARAPSPPAVAAAADEPDLESVHRELSSLQELLQAEARERRPASAAAEARSVPAVPAPRRPTAPPPAPPEEKIVALYIVAPPGQPFAGTEVAEALEQAGLRYDDMHIYQRYPDGSAGGPPVFGVANLVEPGTLEPELLAGKGTPGLSLFLQLPGPLNPVRAFDLFAATAQRLAERLGGELRDRSRSAVSRQSLEHLRDEVQQYELRLRLPRSS